MAPTDVETAGRPRGLERWELAAIAAAVLLALLVRAWAFELRRVVDFDETYYYILGRNLLAGRGYTLNGLPHTAFPPLYPLLVGLVSYLLPTIEAATSAVSAVAGALLPVPVYFLARDVHSKRAAAFSAFATACWPVLFLFAAAGMPYARKMYFGSEPLYVTLLAAGMLFMWLLMRYGGLKNACLAGGFFGLAALVRSEGPVVFAFLFVWLAFDRLVQKKLFSKKTVAEMAVTAAVMLAVFSPFLIHVRAVTGQWTLGAKLVNNSRIRDTLYDWTVNNNIDPFLVRHYALNDDATYMADSYWGVAPWHRANMAARGSIKSGLSLVRSPDWRWAPIFRDAFYKGELALAKWYMWLFIIVGLCCRPWGLKRIRWWSFIIANVAPMFMLAVSLYVLPRHELPLVALLAVSLGGGLAAAGTLLERLSERLGGGAMAMARVAALVPAIVVIFFMARFGMDLNSAVSALAEERGADRSLLSQRQERELAAWLKQKLPPGSTLISHAPWVAVWSGSRWRVMPIADGASFAKYAIASGADYAILEAWRRPLYENYDAVKPFIVERIDVGKEYVLLDFTAARDNAEADLP